MSIIVKAWTTVITCRYAELCQQTCPGIFSSMVSKNGSNEWVKVFNHGNTESGTLLCDYKDTPCLWLIRFRVGDRCKSTPLAKRFKEEIVIFIFRLIYIFIYIRIKQDTRRKRNASLTCKDPGRVRKFVNQKREWWFLTTWKCRPYRYGRLNFTAHRIARHSFSVVE